MSHVVGCKTHGEEKKLKCLNRLQGLKFKAPLGGFGGVIKGEKCGLTYMN